MNDYLWDRSGPEDPEIAELERALAPLAHRGAPPRVRRVRLRPLAIAAGALLAIGGALLLRGGSVPPAPLEGPPLRVAATGATLLPGAWIEARETEHELFLGDVGRITLRLGSRMQVRALGDETTRLFLARGALEASIAADARPRFFQVDTDAARCVDLGCRYTLEVDDAGDARVDVTFGQVAFETETREVYVPRGAVCLAKRGRGPGTPRFKDSAPALAAALDAYDAAPAESRLEAARAALALVERPRDTLAAWHFLQDADAAVARAAEARLAEVAGRPEGDAPNREAWKAHLEAGWW